MAEGQGRIVGSRARDVEIMFVWKGCRFVSQGKQQHVGHLKRLCSSFHGVAREHLMAALLIGSADPAL